LEKYEKIIGNLQIDPDTERLYYQLFGENNADPKAFHNVVRRAIQNLEEKTYREHGHTRLPKIRWVINKIINKETPGPILVFSHFLEAGNRIVAEELRKKNISFGFIQGEVNTKDRTKIVNEYNAGHYRVLLISQAGGEGLDLKNTRTVILMEPSWNMASEEQVIGRAIRFRSHASLPKNQRVVEVFYLNHFKPSDKALFEPTTLWLKDKTKSFYKKNEYPPGLDPYKVSIDFFLRAYLQKKQQDIDRYDEIVKNHSIENHPECTEKDLL